jgi:hypothetical protein
MSKAEQIGTVSVDGGALAVVDATYLMTDEDHDQGRDEGEVVKGYDAAYVPLRADGVFPVFIERNRAGEPVAVRIELQR